MQHMTSTGASPRIEPARNPRGAYVETRGGSHGSPPLLYGERKSSPESYVSDSLSLDDDLRSHPGMGNAVILVLAWLGKCV